ncbi:MAG: 4a-hydroxytetrahydrobiopterin dehydratase [Thaumarchaeota archaeon]|nr:MAG: 4a-hydroxytetrahydrobiopterin dehydratase [Nitrososphaerota archaeon]
MDFTQKKCVSCETGGDPLPDSEVQNNLPNWELDGKMIHREFEFQDFKDAMVFVNKVADLAESEGHHPDITIHWNKVRLDLWTHSMNGLSENDFIVASKIDKI